MTNIMSVDGHRVREAVLKSGYTREKVVVMVQEEGHRFSLAGLDKLIRGELPKRDAGSILCSLAKVCRCSVSYFAEYVEEQSA